MDIEERRGWVLGILKARNGRAPKHVVLGLAMNKGLSHVAAYDLINGMLAADVLRQVSREHGRKELYIPSSLSTEEAAVLDAT
jgi:hypothetical protein